MVDRLLERQLRKLIEARTPVIQVVSNSEERVEATLKSIMTAAKGQLEWYSWTLTDGMRGAQGPIPEADDVREALSLALKNTKPGIYLFKDLQVVMRNDPWIIRRIKDIAASFGKQAKFLFLCCPYPEVPEILRREIYIVEQARPTRQDLAELFDRMVPAGKAPEGVREAFCEAALGMDILEVERALRRSMVGGRALDAALITEILEEKRQAIAATGLLEFMIDVPELKDIGGMGNLKAWLGKRKNAFSEAARKLGVTYPKGILVMGISGCGKSLFIKAIASFWRIPLFKIDMARIYSGAMGGPEDAFRRAVKLAEELSPCVLWFDEIEAGISIAGHKAEGGPGSRILGFFLNWMQEKTTPVFVGATANAIDLLPAEVLRKGRFDEIFYISLPTKEERTELFQVHLRRRGFDPAEYHMDFLVSGTDGFSGSEIEQAVGAACVDAMSQSAPLAEEHLVAAVSRTVPLSVTMAEQIKKIESWAFKRAVPASSFKTYY
ncbi:MAG TPA: AAA family ATPase [Candidatus Sulfotelmatobacter sp.]|nr:AAA family ATPase [Candidatus Sulfotelmatobacter sp.]